MAATAAAVISLALLLNKKSENAPTKKNVEKVGKEIVNDIPILLPTEKKKISKVLAKKLFTGLSKERKLSSIRQELEKYERRQSLGYEKPRASDFSGIDATANLTLRSITDEERKRATVVALAGSAAKITGKTLNTAARVSVFILSKIGQGVVAVAKNRTPEEQVQAVKQQQVQAVEGLTDQLSPSSSKTQCKGITQGGDRCKRMVVGDYCYDHKPK
jgi:hypothetical protein